jgi:general stress protein YciG
MLDQVQDVGRVGVDHESPLGSPNEAHQAVHMLGRKGGQHQPVG